MVTFLKDPSLAGADIPFGVVEVEYPDRNRWREEEFRALALEELAACRARFPHYDRKAVFGDHPYVRYFRKFKKTYPVMLQFESVMFKGQPFPNVNPVTEVPFLLELTSWVLSGTHDADRLQGPVELYLAAEKAPFLGIRDRELHTYPGDLSARDQGGIIFSLIAGTDGRTCARPESRHVFYPLFGIPGLPVSVLEGAMARLKGYVEALSPEAAVQTAFI